MVYIDLKYSSSTANQGNVLHWWPHAITFSRNWNVSTIQPTASEYKKRKYKALNNKDQWIREVNNWHKTSIFLFLEKIWLLKTAIDFTTVTKTRNSFIYYLLPPNNVLRRLRQLRPSRKRGYLTKKRSDTLRTYLLYAYLSNDAWRGTLEDF